MAPVIPQSPKTRERCQEVNMVLSLRLSIHWLMLWNDHDNSLNPTTRPDKAEPVRKSTLQYLYPAEAENVAKDVHKPDHTRLACVNSLYNATLSSSSYAGGKLQAQKLKRLEDLNQMLAEAEAERQKSKWSFHTSILMI